MRKIAQIRKGLGSRVLALAGGCGLAGVDGSEGLSGAGIADALGKWRILSRVG